MKQKKQLFLLLLGGSLLVGACQSSASPFIGVTQPTATRSAQSETIAKSQFSSTGSSHNLTAAIQPVATSTQSAVTTNTTTEFPTEENLGVVNANLIGESMFARQGDWIFQAKESSEEGIIKSKVNQEEQSVLVKKSAKWLNLVGDWLYFVDNSSSGNLAKIKTDGTGYEILHNSMVTDLIVRDNYIYFIDITKGRRIHRIETDGTGLLILDNRERATRLFLEGNMLYWSNYLDGNKISQDILTTAIDGSNNSVGGKAEYLIHAMTVGEGFIFFQTPEENRNVSVIRRKTDTSNESMGLMPSEGISLIGVYKGWLYFYEGYQKMSLSRIRPDGKDREVILGPGNYGRIQFLGDQMMYYDNYFPNYGYWIMDLDGSNARYFR